MSFWMCWLTWNTKNWSTHFCVGLLRPSIDSTRFQKRSLQFPLFPFLLWISRDRFICPSLHGCFYPCKDISVNVYHHMILFSVCLFMAWRLPTSLICSDRGPLRSSDLLILAEAQRWPCFCSHCTEAVLILPFSARRIPVSHSSAPTGSESHRFHQQPGKSFQHPSPCDSLSWKISPLLNSNFVKLIYCSVMFKILVKAPENLKITAENCSWCLNARGHNLG